MKNWQEVAQVTDHDGIEYTVGTGISNIIVHKDTAIVMYTTGDLTYLYRIKSATIMAVRTGEYDYKDM